MLDDITQLGRVETIMFALAISGIIWGIIKLKGDSMKMEGV